MSSRTEYFTVEEVAEMLRITPALIHRWRWAGTAPPAVKLGRRLLFPADELQKWIDERTGQNAAA